MNKHPSTQFRTRGFTINIIVVAVVIVLAGVAVYLTLPKQTEPPPTSIPSVNSNQQVTSVKVYFLNTNLKPIQTCNEVLPTARFIPATTQQVATAAIQELLKGPINEEGSMGYQTTIPAGTKLNSINIVNSEARVDFSDEIRHGQGACAMVSAEAQITQTLLQFPTVKTVKITANEQPNVWDLWP